MAQPNKILSSRRTIDVRLVQTPTTWQTVILLVQALVHPTLRMAQSINNSPLSTYEKALWLKDLCDIYDRYYGFGRPSVEGPEALEELAPMQEHLRKICLEEHQAVAGADRDEEPGFRSKGKDQVGVSEAEIDAYDEGVWLRAEGRVQALIRRMRADNEAITRAAAGEDEEVEKEALLGAEREDE